MGILLIIAAAQYDVYLEKWYAGFNGDAVKVSL